VSQECGCDGFDEAGRRDCSALRGDLGEGCGGCGAETVPGGETPQAAIGAGRVCRWLLRMIRVLLVESVHLCFEPDAARRTAGNEKMAVR
jgi:hypothetical protein